MLLQDRVKPFGSDAAQMRIQQSLKADINTLFARFDEQPLAAASIAQVHTVALHDGREVVVKSHPTRYSPANSARFRNSGMAWCST